MWHYTMSRYARDFVYYLLTDKQTDGRTKITTECGLVPIMTAFVHNYFVAVVFLNEFSYHADYLQLPSSFLPTKDVGRFNHGVVILVADKLKR